jgi:hypothetical protein
MMPRRRSLRITRAGPHGGGTRLTSCGRQSGACGLITRQEAATALGAPVPAGTEKAMDIPMQGRSVKAQYCFYGTEVAIARQR